MSAISRCSLATRAHPSRTDDEAWYISSTPMATPAVNEGNTMNLRHLAYDDSPGAWRELPLGPPTPGALAGDLSGSLISGVGIVQEITNGDGDFSSWNYADYRIFAVPEPATIAILVGVAAACFVRRRAKARNCFYDRRITPARNASEGIAVLSLACQLFARRVV